MSQPPEPDAEVSRLLVDIRGFDSQSQLFRSSSRKRKAPEGGAEGEYDQIVARGGPFISEDTLLGKSISGERNIILPSLKATEKLIHVDVGLCKSCSSAATTAAKELSVRFGSHNVGDCLGWLDAEGERLLSFPATQMWTEPTSKRIFCDNITLWTESDPKSGRETVFQFMKCFGLQSHKGSSEAEEKHWFFVKLCLKSKKDQRSKWKVSLAELNIDLIEMLYRGLQLAEDVRNRDLEKVMGALYQKFKNEFAKSSSYPKSLDFANFAKAISCGTKLFYCDIDLTIDVPGTLDCSSLKTLAHDHGYGTIQSENCGKNLVRLELIKTESYMASVKFYNKIHETLEQGDAKSQSIASKIGYLLNPSTKHLQQTFRNEEYYAHGVTRYETTFSSRGTGQTIPKFKDMIFQVEKMRFLLSPATLVTKSIEDHIKCMEVYVKRSVVVYYPGVYEAKKDQWDRRPRNAADKNNRALRNRLNEIPDGFIITHNNSASGKFVGHVLNSHFTGRSNAKVSGWTRVSQAAAWASSIQEDPLMFICVRGLLGTGESEQSSSRIYFRKIPIKKVIPSLERPWMYIPWNCTFMTFNYQNKCLDWQMIGINVDNLQNLRFKAIDPDVRPSFQTMGSVDIELDGVDMMSHEGSGSSLATDEKERLTGVGKSIYELDQHGGLLDNWIAWSEYKLCSVGKFRRPKLRFCVKGTWFWLPTSLKVSDEIINFLKQQASLETKVCAEVQISQAGDFEWRQQGCEKRFYGPCKAAKHIPVQSTPMAVLQAGEQATGRSTAAFVCLDGGKFFLPQSIYSSLQKLADGNSFETMMIGMQIYHANSKFSRVPGMKNCEEYLSILDCDGSVVATNYDFDALKRR